MPTPFRIRNPKYGWIPDLPDRRDFLYTVLAPSIGALPDHVDLRSECSPVEDQGQLGSCTAQALVGNLELLQNKDHHERLDFSRLFLYYNERLIRHTQGSDSGASLRDGIKTLAKAGDCLEHLWPYDIREFREAPSEEAYTNALQYQITNYYRILSTQEMKHTLSTGYPFVFGFAVYDSFESPDVAATGIVPLPDPTERLLGGHAVLAVGYDDAKSVFIVRNSWGENWGDKGYFYLPYAYIAHKDLASDFWTIREME